MKKQVIYLFILSCLITKFSNKAIGQTVSGITSSNITAMSSSQSIILQRSCGLTTVQKDSAQAVYTRFYSAVSNLNSQGLSSDQRYARMQALVQTKEASLQSLMNEEQWSQFLLGKQRMQQRQDSVQKAATKVN